MNCLGYSNGPKDTICDKVTSMGNAEGNYASYQYIKNCVDECASKSGCDTINYQAQNSYECTFATGCANPETTTAAANNAATTNQFYGYFQKDKAPFVLDTLEYYYIKKFSNVICSNAVLEGTHKTKDKCLEACTKSLTCKEFAIRTINGVGLEGVTYECYTMDEPCLLGADSSGITQYQRITPYN